MSGWRGAVVPVALVIAAELAAIAVDLKSDSLARPSDIIAAGFEAVGSGNLVRATGATLAAAAIGLGLGAVLGLAAGIVLGLSKIADRLMEFSVEAFRPIPSVALIPIAMLIWGFGYGMEIAIIAFATFWPVLILSRAAVGGIEPRLLEVSRALGLGFLARVGKIVLPAALPRIFVAVRLAVGIALIVAVTVEIAANPQGLGFVLMDAQQSLRPDLMFAYLVWVGIVGWSLNALMLWSQRRLFGPAAVLEAER
jgi:NitT/TauT family transport system permease protein